MLAKVWSIPRWIVLTVLSTPDHETGAYDVFSMTSTDQFPAQVIASSSSSASSLVHVLSNSDFTIALSRSRSVPCSDSWSVVLSQGTRHYLLSLHANALYPLLSETTVVDGSVHASCIFASYGHLLVPVHPGMSLYLTVLADHERRLRLSHKTTKYRLGYAYETLCTSFIFLADIYSYVVSSRSSSVHILVSPVHKYLILPSTLYNFLCSPPTTSAIINALLESDALCRYVDLFAPTRVLACPIPRTESLAPVITCDALPDQWVALLRHVLTVMPPASRSTFLELSGFSFAPGTPPPLASNTPADPMF